MNPVRATTVCEEIGYMPLRTVCSSCRKVVVLFDPLPPLWDSPLRLANHSDENTRLTFWDPSLCHVINNEEETHMTLWDPPGCFKEKQWGPYKIKESSPLNSTGTPPASSPLRVMSVHHRQPTFPALPASLPPWFLWQWNQPSGRGLYGLTR